MAANDMTNQAFDNAFGAQESQGQGSHWTDYDAIASSKENKLRLSSETEYIKMRDKLYKNSRLKELEEQLKDKSLSENAKKALEEQAFKERQKLEERAINATTALMENRYKQAGNSQKAQMIQQERDALNKKKASLDEEYEYAMALAAGDADEQERLTQELKDNKLAIIKEEQSLRDKQSKLEQSQGSQVIKNFKENFKKSADHTGKSFIGGVAGMVSALGKVSISDIAGEMRAEKEKQEAELDELKNEYDEMKANGASEEELAAQEAKIKAKDKEVALAQAIDGVTQSLNKFSEGIGKAYNEAFTKAENMLTSYKSHIEARLQGSQKDYESIMDKVNSNLSLSPYVRTQDVIDAMREAIDQGITYNLEQRAFLSEIKDKIANTFDAFDSNLTRLIRLQQADTTAARLGMEAALTKFLNEMFEDSSYLNKGNSQVVAGALIDASSTMTKEQSAEFEFIVQKWMGSLTSVGIDSGTVNTLVQAINYLATGDVQSLSSNTEMQTLLAMSAAKAGLEYSELLLEGLDASNTNKLLKSMVEYLKDIAEDSDNLVVKAAYGNVFGMNMSDFTAISNLSSGDIANISKVAMSYSDMYSELDNQFSMLSSRTSIAERLKNLYNNAIFGVAQDMVNNPISYAMTKVLKFMEDSEINMNIPFINAMGFGLDLNANVQDLLRLGLGVGQSLSLVGNIVGGLTSDGGLDLNKWGFNEYTSRGSGLSFSTGTSLAQTSSSTYVTTQSSKDMENSALNSATDDAEESKEITNKNTKSEYTFDDFFRATIGEQASSWITSQDMFIKKAFEADDLASNFLSVRDKTAAENFAIVKHDTNAIKVRLDSLYGPIPISLGESPAGSMSAEAINKKILAEAFKGVFADTKVKVVSSTGNDRIPVDTELVINKPDTDNSHGYRTGSITW
jgi:hypothetical protein